jgi:nitrogen regulatory protein PII-like uncharacterized protein
MKSYLNLPTLILISFLIRLLIMGASIGDALVIIALSSLYGFFYFIESKKEPEANKELKDRIVELEEQVKIVKDKAASLSLASSFKR